MPFETHQPPTEFQYSSEGWPQYNEYPVSSLTTTVVTPHNPDGNINAPLYQWPIADFQPSRALRQFMLAPFSLEEERAFNAAFDAARCLTWNSGLAGRQFLFHAPMMKVQQYEVVGRELKDLDLTVRSMGDVIEMHLRLAQHYALEDAAMSDTRTATQRNRDRVREHRAQAKLEPSGTVQAAKTAWKQAVSELKDATAKGRIKIAQLRSEYDRLRITQALTPVENTEQPEGEDNERPCCG